MISSIFNCVTRTCYSNVNGYPVLIVCNLISRTLHIGASVESVKEPALEGGANPRKLRPHSRRQSTSMQSNQDDLMGTRGSYFKIMVSSTDKSLFVMISFLSMHSVLNLFICEIHIHRVYYSQLYQLMGHYQCPQSLFYCTDSIIFIIMK